MKIDLDAVKRSLVNGLGRAGGDAAPPASAEPQPSSPTTEARGIRVRTDVRGGKAGCKGFLEKSCGGEG